VQTLTQPDTQVQLFGLTNEQGAYGAGTIIKFNAGEDENNLSVLHNFKHQDGGAAYGALLQADDGLLYGVTAGYFTDANKGTVFSIRPDGTGYTVLHGFQDPEGINPTGTLIQASDGLLYGLTRYGGLTGNGSVFRMNPDGSGFTVLHHFVYLSDGASPTGKLLQVADGSLLGVCATGGTYNVGTIFSIQPDGTGFTVLRHFQTTAQSYPDGSLTQGPGASVVGMTAGSSNLTPGTIYSINTDGSGFTILHFFAC
jgi:uncharacterized repeat protein (TIGR03803 family)